MSATEACDPVRRHPELAATACDSETKIWDLRARRLVATLPGSLSVATSRGRAWTINTDSRAVRGWDLVTGRELAERHVAARATSIAASDEGVLVVGDASGGVYVFDSLEATTPRTLFQHEGEVSVVAQLPDGRIVTVERAGKVRVLSPAGRLISELDGLIGAYEMEISQHGTHAVLLGTQGADVIVLELGAVPRIDRFHGHKHTTTNARFEPGGRRLLTTSSDGTAARWDLASGALLQRYTNTPYLADVAIDASGQVVIALDGIGRLVYYDAETGRRLGATDGTGRSGSRMWLAPDAQSAAALGRTGELAFYRIPYDITPTATLEHELSCFAPTSVGGETCR